MRTYSGFHIDNFYKTVITFHRKDHKISPKAGVVQIFVCTTSFPNEKGALQMRTNAEDAILSPLNL